MALRTILIHPDPRLKKQAAPVMDVTDDVRRLADDMLETMYDAPGIGLAAPQIGVMDRMIVMDCVKDADATPRPMVMLNPKVTWTSEAQNTYEEGCLSIPDQFAEVVRPAEAEVSWTDLKGAKQVEKFDGLWATCVQHEIDHLEGITFVDYLSKLKKDRILEKTKKIRK
ncbi:MAG: peptide deformylase, partial [Planktomarina sp.]